jgi:hypothetical protein
MTTKYSSNSFLVATLVFTALVSLPVYAQSDPASTNSEVVSLNEATSTESLATTTEVAETEPSWFRVEKLTGDNLAVGDMVIGPGKAELEVKPGQTMVFEISVSNRISDNRTFEINVEDIAGSADGSRPVELLGSDRGPYSLKDYITFPNNRFELDLGERARIPVTISIPPDAEPGGFYGSVLISTVQTKEVEDSSTTARSPIIARIGTLFFVTVPGEVEHQGETKEITLVDKKWWFEKGPIELSILYENTGSVHLNPYGEMRIKNLFGEEVGFVELDPWFVLPESLRSREVTWDRELLFGRYEATVSINRGYDDVVDERSVVFWVLPWKIVGGVFIILFIIIFSLRFFFRTFEFKRKA